MKKSVLIFVLVFVLTLLSACGGNTNNSQNNLQNNSCTHNWIDATCTTPQTCSLCGITGGAAFGHNWNAATCTTPQTCSVCGITECSANGHSWSQASCTTPKVCSVCNFSDGAASGHNWSEATCTTPKTCKTCNATEGSLSACKDNGSGRCVYCGADTFLSNLKNNLSLQLIVPSVGASNNYYFQVKYVNNTGSTISLDQFVTANGRMCVNNQAKGYDLPNNYEITISYYRSIVPSERYDDKYKDMYLDNASMAEADILINGKTISVKFGTNGITEIGYSQHDISHYKN